MGFDAPLALLAMLAGALPFIAHRIRRKDLPVIALPTFALLAATSKQQRSRRDLGDLLLLLVRTLLLLLAAVALASPYVLSEVAFGDGTISSAVLVVDDSMSMRREDGGESLLEQALDRAEDAAAALPAGSRVGVVLAGSPARLVTELTEDLGAVRAALSAVQPSDRSTDLGGALALARQQLQASGDAQRRVLVLSDFAASSAPDRLEPGSGLDVRFERVGDKPRAGNIYFHDVHVTPDPLDKGKVALSVTVKRTGSSPAQARLVAHGGNGDEQSRDLTFERSTARINFSITRPAPGKDPVVRLQLEADDALAADNHAEALVDRTDALRVLLVNGDPHPGTARDELYYARKALNLVPQGSEPLRVRTIDAATLRHADLTQSDVLVLANVPAPGEEVSQRIVDFVREGGGLLVAAGSTTDPSAYNGSLGALLPGHISAVSRARGVQLAEDQDASGLLASGLSGLREARFDQHLLIDSTEPPLLRFASGSPAVTRRRFGDGVVVLFASSLDDGWTDLPLRPGYLPMLGAMLRAAAGARATFAERYAAGDSVHLPVPHGAGVLEVVTPDGETRRLDELSGDTVPFTETDLAGGYRVVAGEGHSALRFVPGLSFEVVRDEAESELRPGKLPTSSAGEGGGEKAVGQSRTSLSPYLLLLAGALLIAEAALRRRPSGPPIGRVRSAATGA